MLFTDTTSMIYISKLVVIGKRGQGSCKEGDGKKSVLSTRTITRLGITHSIDIKT